MSVPQAIFYTFSTLSVLTALCVVFHPKPTRSLLALIVTMFSMAVLFILLGAHFIAMIHIIVYAGAVLVLFLFVIMLQGVGANSIPLLKRFNPFFIGAAFVVSMALFYGIFRTIQNAGISEAVGIDGSIENIGKTLFVDYLLPFELASILLLLGIFAAVALAKKEDAE